jgi:hypothetical protein
VKKLAAALLVVAAVTLRFAGGEMSRSAVFDRFKGFVDILAVLEYLRGWSLTGDSNILVNRLIEYCGCRGRREGDWQIEARPGARGHVPAKVQFGLSFQWMESTVDEVGSNLGVTCMFRIESDDMIHSIDLIPSTQIITTATNIVSISSIFVLGCVSSCSRTS